MLKSINHSRKFIIFLIILQTFKKSFDKKKENNSILNT